MSENIHSRLMKRACDLASEGIKNNSGPFGAVIADDAGNVISEAFNMTMI
jgi:tRNA(Arg) A34 adenosine deaminase TadA